jgi:hypothetical protein
MRVRARGMLKADDNKENDECGMMKDEEKRSIE